MQNGMPKPKRRRATTYIPATPISTAQRNIAHIPVCTSVGKPLNHSSDQADDRTKEDGPSPPKALVDPGNKWESTDRTKRVGGAEETLEIRLNDILRFPVSNVSCRVSKV